MSFVGETGGRLQVDSALHLHADVARLCRLTREAFDGELEPIVSARGSFTNLDLREYVACLRSGRAASPGGKPCVCALLAVDDGEAAHFATFPALDLQSRHQASSYLTT
jgi:hypothetical protein